LTEQIVRSAVVAAGLLDVPVFVCEALLTEDLQHGLDIDGLRIADPFRTAVGSLP
jgi:predicted nucleic acid-binding protein